MFDPCFVGFNHPIFSSFNLHLSLGSAMDRCCSSAARTSDGEVPAPVELEANGGTSLVARWEFEAAAWTKLSLRA